MDIDTKKNIRSFLIGCLAGILACFVIFFLGLTQYNRRIKDTRGDTKESRFYFNFLATFPLLLLLLGVSFVLLPPGWELVSQDDTKLKLQVRYVAWGSLIGLVAMGFLWYLLGRSTRIYRPYRDNMGVGLVIVVFSGVVAGLYFAYQE